MPSGINECFSSTARRSSSTSRRGLPSTRGRERRESLEDYLRAAALRLPAHAAAGPPARPRHVGLPAARPQSQGAQALPARVRGQQGREDLCRGARRRARAESGNVDLALDKMSTAEAGWRMVPDPAGRPAVTHWRVACVRDGRAVIVFTPETGPHPPDPRPRLGRHRHPDPGDPVYGLARGRCCSTLCRCAWTAATSRRSRRRRRCRRASSAPGSATSTWDGRCPLSSRGRAAGTFLAASGPGGQNVNKVATACQLRCDVFALGLAPDVYRRLKALAGSRMNAAGEIVITARRFRTQEANREDARARLAELIDKAHVGQPKRRPTRPSRAAKAKRVDSKKQRGASSRAAERCSWTDVRFQDRSGGQGLRSIAELIEAADALTAGEPDPIANMANVAALLWESVPDLNWAGFYRNRRGRAGPRPVPGPAGLHPHPVRQGRLRRGRVDPRAAAGRRRPRFSRPYRLRRRLARRTGRADRRRRALVGVLDLDSPTPGRFDKEDEEGCVILIQRLGARLGGMAKDGSKGKRPVHPAL